MAGWQLAEEPERTLDALLPMLHHGRHDERARAAWALRLLESSDPRLRRLALRGLRHRLARPPLARDAVLARLDDADVRVRWEAVFAVLAIAPNDIVALARAAEAAARDERPARWFSLDEATTPETARALLASGNETLRVAARARLASAPAAE